MKVIFLHLKNVPHCAEFPKSYLGLCFLLAFVNLQSALAFMVRHRFLQISLPTHCPLWMVKYPIPALRKMLVIHLVLLTKALRLLTPLLHLTNFGATSRHLLVLFSLTCTGEGIKPCVLVLFLQWLVTFCWLSPLSLTF